MKNKYRPCIWYDGNALEAVEYYADVFPNVRVGEISYHAEEQPEFNKDMAGKVLVATWWMENQEYMALNAGPMFPHSENFSIEVMCEDQAEVDLYWDRLVGDGGQESACGWCKDKFGVSWQIVPKRFYELFNDPKTSQAVTNAMYSMQKLIVADLEAAAESVQ